jgi:hypothetical protein
MPDLFPVMVHGVKMSNINIADQRQTNKRLADQNATLHPNLKIVRTTWARLVFVSSLVQANQVITEGFIGGEVKITEILCRVWPSSVL